VTVDRPPPPPQSVLIEATSAPLGRLARTLVDCRLTRQEAISLLHQAVDETAARLGWDNNPTTEEPTP
jgi:hypothetical protein